jgi:hypothetical protein
MLSSCFRWLFLCVMCFCDHRFEGAILQYDRIVHYFYVVESAYDF